MRVHSSPEVVKTLDVIRRQLEYEDDLAGVDEHAEFYLFARDYPRCYRFHLDCSDYRLTSIYEQYLAIRIDLAGLASKNPGSFEYGIGDRRVEIIYWDFESYLSEINIALDLLARIVGIGFPQHTPPSFNRLCKSKLTGGLIEILRAARQRWVLKLKDYRDCFTHYTPIDTRAVISLLLRKDGTFDLWGKLPVNPNIREILGFRFSRRVELLRYAITVHRHMTALDRAVAREIWRAFRRNEYPSRRSGLFFVASRVRQQPSNIKIQKTRAES